MEHDGCKLCKYEHCSMDVSMGMLFDKKVMNVETWLQSEVEE